MSRRIRMIGPVVVSPQGRRGHAFDTDKGVAVSFPFVSGEPVRFGSELVKLEHVQGNEYDCTTLVDDGTESGKREAGSDRKTDEVIMMGDCEQGQEAGGDGEWEMEGGKESSGVVTEAYRTGWDRTFGKSDVN